MGESLDFPEGTGFQASRTLQGQSPSRGGDGLRPQQRALCTEGLAGVTGRPYRGHPGSRASAQAGTRAAGGTARSLEVVRTRTRRAPDGRYVSSPELTLGVPAARGGRAPCWCCRGARCPGGDRLHCGRAHCPGGGGAPLWMGTLPWRESGSAVDKHAALEGSGFAVDKHAALEGVGLRCGQACCPGGGQAPLWTSMLPWRGRAPP